jgi:hypothetical protein
MKTNFLLELLGGIGSRISSRRTVMVWFVLLFSFEIVVNIFTGGEKGLQPAPELRMELFQVLIVSLVLVFGDIVVKVLEFLRGKKIDIPPTPTDPPPTPPADQVK